MTTFNSPFSGNVIQPTDVSYRQITLSADTQLEWPINGSATDDYAARIMEVEATAADLTLTMPPANQASVGQDALIRSTGDDGFTVNDYNGDTIVYIAPGESKYIYITDNGDEAGVWGVIAFGVGSSAADAATLAGYGLKAVSTTLNQSHSVVTFSAAYTAVASDRASSYVWTGGAGTLSLTGPSTLGNDWFMLIRNGGSGSLTVSPLSGLINGSATITLQPSDSAFIVCSGTAFYTVGLGRAAQFNFTQLTKAVTSGAYTLSASEAANVVQKYTGTLTGNVTVTLPQTVQVYYISNQTDGGVSAYTITFNTGIAGGASAVVPASNQVILMCDSVNLLNASTIVAGATTTSLDDGNVGSPSLNFASETSTGVYRPSSGNFAVSILATQRLLVNASGITVNGNVVAVDVSASGNVSGDDITASGNMSATGTGNFVGGIAGGAF